MRVFEEEHNHPTMYLSSLGYSWGVSPWCRKLVFSLALFFSLFFLLLWAWEEEIKLRVTGTHTFTRTRWAQGVSCFASTVAVFSLFFFSFAPFMLVPPLPPFGSKSDLGKTTSVTPFRLLLGTSVSSEASRLLSENSA